MTLRRMIVFEGEVNEPCVVCVKGKQTRRPNKDDGTRATEPLQLVHSDVIGPMNPNSFGGSRFLVTFVDDFSRKVFVYPLKNKSEVFDIFFEFKQMAEKQCSRKIKTIRADNGDEYINKKFSSFLKNNGIVHKKTCAYTPEQNSIAERLKRTIIERVGCMLIDSGLDQRFWAEAANTASFLINKTLCRGESRSPSEGCCIETLQSDDVNSGESMNLLEFPSCSSESEPQVSERVEEIVELEPQVYETSNNDSNVSIYDGSVEWSSPLPEPREESDGDWIPNVNNITETNKVRRSERLTNIIQNNCIDFVSNDPSSVKDAMSSENAVKGKNAIFSLSNYL